MGKDFNLKNMGHCSFSVFFWLMIFTTFVSFPGFSKEIDVSDDSFKYIQQLTKQVSLRLFFEIVLKNNPELSSKLLKFQSQEAKVDQIGEMPDPKLTFSHMFEPVETKTGPLKQKIRVLQSLPGKNRLLLSKKAQKLLSKAEYCEFIIKKLELKKNSAHLFYDYILLKKELEVLQEKKKLLILAEAVAQTRFKTGNIMQYELLNIQIKQSELENSLEELKNRRISLSTSLLAIAGINEYSESVFILPWPKIDNIQNILNHSFEIKSIKKDIDMYSPELKKLNFHLDENRTLLRLSKKAFSPVPSVGLEYSNIESGPDPWGVFVSLDLLVHKKPLQASVKKKKMFIKALERNYENKRNSLFSKAVILLNRLNDSIRKYNLYDRDLILRAEQAMETSFKAFETGKSSFFELLSSLDNYLDYTFLKFNSIISANKINWDLKTLIGLEK
jgi:outer membrane protein TolC